MDARSSYRWWMVPLWMAGALAAFGEDGARDYFQLGLRKEGVQEYIGSIAYFTRAIELDPKFAPAYAERAYSKRQLRHFADALFDYDRALELDPKSTTAHFRHGVVGRESCIDDAIAEYTREMESRPGVGICGARGRLYYLKRAWPEALSDLRHYVDTDQEGQCRENSYLWLLLMRLGEKDAAHRVIAEKVARQMKASLGSQISTLDAFLLNQIKEHDFLMLSETSSGDIQYRQPQDTWFFPGMVWENPFLHDKADAEEFFKKWLAVTPGRRPEAGLLADTRLSSGDIESLQEHDAWTLMGMGHWLGNGEDGVGTDFKSFCAGVVMPHEVASLLMACKTWRGIDVFALVADPVFKRDNNPQRRCEAYFFVAMKRLFRGDKANAVRYLGKSVETRLNTVTEYQFAESELQALRH